MTTENPNILITGAAGYVGQLTLEALLERQDGVGRLVGMDIREPDNVAEGCIWVTQDIAEPGLQDILREHAIDIVVHLASIVRPPRQKGSESLAHRVDVVGTRNLLQACVATSVRKIVVTTSGAAYGYWPDNPEWIDEDQPVRGHPDFEYARNKRLVEEMLAEHRRSHPDLKQLIFRPGTILGEGTSNQITDLFEKPVMMGIMGTSTPFVFIWDRDVAECLASGALDERTGIYNLAGDGVVTGPEIARRLGKPYIPLPAPMVRASLALLKRLGLTQYGPEQVGFLQYRPVLSNRRLKEGFGYVPRSSREVFELYASAREHHGTK